MMKDETGTAVADGTNAVCEAETGKVKLYSTNCPKCRVLEIKLRQKNIPHTVVTDMEKIVGTGHRTVPLLEADGKIMEFTEALEFIRKK